MSNVDLCVIGMGYIGLPTASTFASKGLRVVGMDVNTAIIDMLQHGEVHIYEPGLRELALQAFNSGNLTVSAQVTPANAFIIAVPTPFYADKRADMHFVASATESILPHLKQGNLVILESTSPPKTTVDLVAPILEKSGLKAGIDFFLAYSPERVLPGRILDELVHNSRVIGGVNPDSANAGKRLYQTFVEGEIILTDATTAEMVKLMENTSRDVDIAIANEFCRLAEKFGVDIWEAISIANRHPRINILKPGIGVGGHCISVDPWFLVEAAPREAELVLTARKVNDSQPAFVSQVIDRMCGSLKGKTVAFLGLSFKPDVDDLRESPAVELAHLLIEKGARLVAFEPFKPEAKLAGIPYATDLTNALKGADMIILAVAHQQFKNLDPVEIRKMTSADVIFDGVNGLDKTVWEKAGFTYLGLAKK